MIKEVPVFKTVEVGKPYEVIKHVPIIKTVEVEKEVIKKVPVAHISHYTKEVSLPKVKLPSLPHLPHLFGGHGAAAEHETYESH